MEKHIPSLGEWLLARGEINEEVLRFALNYQQRRPEVKLGTILREFGFVSSDVIVEYLSKYAPDNLAEEKLFKTTLPVDQLKQEGILVLAETDEYIVAGGLDYNKVRKLAQTIGKKIRPRPVDINILVESLSQSSDLQTEGQNQKAGSFEAIETQIKNDPNDAIKFLLRRALELNASDIHVDPTHETYVLRLRVDGILHPMAAISPEAAAILIARIKGLAGMDIAEKLLPQDGSFLQMFGSKMVNIRVATSPTVNGEACILRILDRDKVIVPLESLGLHRLDLWKQVIRSKDGLILVTGATGSGKSTTLYATLQRLNRIGQTIITIEDPVEYQFPFIRQVQVNRNVGLDFAVFLRSALRQDPDIILVGEVRDPETARIMLQAAETGHLVFATLHANNIVAAFSRLRDLGVPPGDLKYLLRAILSQTLLRKLCDGCNGKGCRYCFNTGYRGRVLASELEAFSPENVQPWIEGNSPQYYTLFDDAMRLVREGKTDLREVERVFGYVEPK